ncbi:hypothetical protein [Bacillus horti]|uniref:Spore coat associated protein CotJA n=1 Tax=Caldalkalibacillus horti TaxID=77523 RepID=A0ABT9W4H9_9BACI|nr:hypothetical protein [Bacillus horti]MDQ0168147.1 hypothetical protein [Bacillus horti]
MGYYPPYVPDTYLQTFRTIPTSRVAIKPVEPIPYKRIEPKRWEQQLRQPEDLKKQTGLGLNFDQYI